MHLMVDHLIPAALLLSVVNIFFVFFVYFVVDLCVVKL